MSSSSKTHSIKPGDIVIPYYNLIMEQPPIGNNIGLNDLISNRRITAVEYTSSALLALTGGAVGSSNRFYGMMYNPSPEADYVIICIPALSNQNKRYNFPENKFFKISKSEAHATGRAGLLRYASCADNIEQFAIHSVSNGPINMRQRVNGYTLDSSTNDSIDAFNRLITSEAYITRGSMRFTIAKGGYTNGNASLVAETYIHILVTLPDIGGIISSHKFIFDVDRVTFTTRYDIVDSKQRKAIVKDSEVIAVKAKGSPLTENKKHKVLEVIQKSSSNSEEDILIVMESDSKVMKTHTVKAKLLKYADD